MQRPPLGKKSLYIVWSIVATPQSGKFSGIKMKGWEMDEEKRRERLGGGVSESREREGANLSNLSFGNWFLLHWHDRHSKLERERMGE